MNNQNEIDEFEQAEDVELYRPRTELGRKLVELRQKAISEGMDLWDADRIAYEVRERKVYPSDRDENATLSERRFKDGWNACRAAMLAAAPKPGGGES